MATNPGAPTLLARVRRFVAQHHLAERGTRVAVALSGGSDSVALAHIVRDLDAAGELQAAGLVHFNHQLRETADRDEQFSVRLAESFGWRIVVERERRCGSGPARTAVDRETRPARHATNVSIARVRRSEPMWLRLVTLATIRPRRSCLRLLRGAGPKGLAGMHPRQWSDRSSGVVAAAATSCGSSSRRVRSPTWRTKRTPT